MKGTCLFLRSLVALWAFLGSCRLWELRDPSGIQTYPSEPNSVICEKIWVSFPCSPDRSHAEALFSVKDSLGSVPGRFQWEGNTLYFLPEPPLKPGTRYVLSFNGTYRDTKGKSYEEYRTVPFFYQYQSESAPSIRSILPSRGEIVSAKTEIEITFDREMDPPSFEKGFSLSPPTPHEVHWTDTNRTVRISPRQAWQDRTLYTLSFGEGIVDRRGMPIASTPSTTFLVQEDTGLPYVRSVEAALNDGETFPPLGSDLEGLLRHRDPIRITFSEAMDQKKTRQAVRITPSLPGTWTWLEDRTLLFLPATGWERGVHYTLEVGAAAEDTSGNRILPFTPLTFHPHIEPLTVEILLVNDGVLFDGESCSPTRSRTLSLSPPTWSDYTLLFTFRGGSFPTDKEKLSVQKGIQLSCIFPPSSPSPIPQGYSWVGDTQLSISYTGLYPSTAQEEYLYLLTLKGGEGGIRTSEGNDLPKEFVQLLITGSQ